MGSRRKRGWRRVALPFLVVGLSIVGLATMPPREPGARVSKHVGRNVALASFVLAVGALVWVERELRKRREAEEAEAVLREELERYDRG